MQWLGAGSQVPARKAGKTSGLSFGYRARQYRRDAEGRQLTEIDLYEVSLVTNPMQHAARVHMVEGANEVKFNQRHYAENGQFARAGEGILYGGGATSRLTSRSPQFRSGRAISRIAELRGSSSNDSIPQPDIIVTGDRDRQLRVDFDATFAHSNASRANKQPQNNPANATRNPSRNYRLGTLSKLHESGRSGPETVSSGAGDEGGVSYGLYQFTSRFPVYIKRKRVGYRVGGTVRTFLSSQEGSPWRAEFAALTPGTPAFSDTWKRVARRHGGQFGDAQHTFIRRTHYDPAVNGVSRLTGLDLDGRSEAIRNAVWSVAVQHKKSVEILSDAVRVTDISMSRNDPEYDRGLINNIYRVRSNYVLNNVSPRTTARSIVANRYVEERRDALRMLDGTFAER